MSDFFDFNYSPDALSFSSPGYDFSNLSIGYDPYTSGGFDFNFDLNPADTFAFGNTGVDYASLLNPSESGTTWDSLAKALGGADWKGILGTGLGALGMYGNYRAGKDQSKAAMMNAQTNAGQLALANRLAKADEAKGLASKAAISNILASRGHLSADNSNPWLNYIYQAQKEGGFTPQGDNPFEGYDVGKAVGKLDLSQLMAGLEAMNANAPQVGYAGGGIVRGALNALRKMDVDGLARRTMKPSELEAGWLAENSPEITEDYMRMMQELNQRLANKMDPEVERAFIRQYLDPRNGMANGGPAGNAGPVMGQGGGQDDVVEAAMAPGEYVFDAESVSALGDGNTEEGARKLDQMRENIRRHKRGGALSSIPPRAHDPMKYLGGK